MQSCVGAFTCDCRGVGTDWRVDELRTVASALLGTVDIVARPDDLAADFRALTGAAMAKNVPDCGCGCGRRRARRCGSSSRSRPRSRT